MADSVARRPHTATSVRGLISPPSPILVVWLPFTVSLSLAFASICLFPPLPYSLPRYSISLTPVFRLIIFIFSLLDPSVTLHLLAPPFFHNAPSRLSPAASIFPPYLLCASQAAHSSPERFASSSCAASSPHPSSSLPVCFFGWTASLCLAWVRWLWSCIMWLWGHFTVLYSGVQKCAVVLGRSWMNTSMLYIKCLVLYIVKTLKAISVDFHRKTLLIS